MEKLINRSKNSFYTQILDFHCPSKIVCHTSKSLVPIGVPGNRIPEPADSGFAKLREMRLVISLLPVSELGLGHGRLLHPQLRVLQIYLIIFSHKTISSFTFYNYFFHSARTGEVSR